MEEIILDTDFVKIIYNPDTKLLVQRWKRVITSEEYRKGFQTSLDTVIKYNIPLFLSDTTQEGIVAPDDRKWLEEVVIPQAVKNGLKYSATIMDKDLFKKYYLGKIKNASEQTGMRFRIFDDYDEGLKWLLSQRNKI